MPRRMLVHDTRLGGTAPSIAQNTYVVDGSVSTRHIVDWVGQYARSQGGLDELIIMCHGYTVLTDTARQMTMAEPIGSDGLMLGRDNLNLTNVGMTRAWRPHIRSIYLYACGTASPSGSGAPRFDGRRFCGELALWSGARVFAADRIQWYVQATPPQSILTSIFGSTAGPRIDFGDWEGQVYRFSPSDGSPTPVTLGPQPH